MNRDDHHLHHYPPTAAATSPTLASRRESSGGSSEGGGGGLFGKSKYKLWVLAAILLLAFWSMFTGTVTLKWSAGDLTRLSDHLFDTPIYEDPDILEVEEREKIVRHMWEVYIHSTNKLPHFWSEAFQAAYDSLASEVQSVRDAAVSEIAKLSLSSAFVTPGGDSSAALLLPARPLSTGNVRAVS